MLYDPTAWKGERKQIGKWLNRLRWKSLWKRYQIDDNYSYQDFADRSIELATDVQNFIGRPQMSINKAWDAWYCLKNLLTSPNYQEAYEGMLKLIYLDY